MVDPHQSRAQHFFEVKGNIRFSLDPAQNLFLRNRNPLTGLFKSLTNTQVPKDLMNNF